MTLRKSGLDRREVPIMGKAMFNGARKLVMRYERYQKMMKVSGSVPTIIVDKEIDLIDDAIMELLKGANDYLDEVEANEAG